MNKKLLVALIAAGIGGCQTDFPLQHSYYGVDQVMVHGRPQYVLCNPCLQPSVKRPATPSSTAPMMYGDQIGASMGGAAGPVLSMAHTMSSMGVPVANNMLTRSAAASRLAQSNATPKATDAPSVPKAPPVAGKESPDSKREVTLTASAMPSGSAVPSVTKQEVYTIRFGHDSHELTTEALDTLNKLVNDKSRLETIQIRGFTDSVGHKAYNDWLAKARMESVKDWLMEKGFDEKKLLAKPDDSQGMCCYVEDNRTVKGRNANRRVELNAKYQVDAPVPVNASAGQSEPEQSMPSTTGATAIREPATVESMNGVGAVSATTPPPAPVGHDSIPEKEPVVNPVAEAPLSGQVEPTPTVGKTEGGV